MCSVLGAVEGDGNTIEVKQCVAPALPSPAGGGNRGWSGFRFDGGAGAEQAHDATRQEQVHEDEHRAGGVERDLRQRAGEPGLPSSPGPRRDGGDQGAPAADRDRDDGLDRVAGCELAWVDNANLRHVERAADAGHDGGEDPDDQIVGLRR